ncbi:MAG: family ATPase [Mucilaginibacter sp.]|nr:family ATPase [Mucilaginibacter sp.]
MVHPVIKKLSPDKYEIESVDQDCFLEEALDEAGIILSKSMYKEEGKIYLKSPNEPSNNYPKIIGDSPELNKIFRLVELVAPSVTTVLILGETGTGKELIAQAIHKNSPRKSKPMVIVNCASFPPNLIESELFGHERGSFTGATERHIGKFEQAINGTLFLDEIGEVSIDLQVKLLRVLQAKEIERVGGKGTIKVNVRVIAATNRDLEKEVREGRFRMDLYYRLCVFPVCMPPLRDRRGDIPALVSHFILLFSKEAGRKIDSLNNRVLQELMQYNWPGNVRELEHLIERTVLLTTGNTINVVNLPSRQNQIVDSAGHEVRIKTICENERDHILEILRICRGKIAGVGGAADLLDVPPTTLHSKIRRLGIRKEHLS